MRPKRAVSMAAATATTALVAATVAAMSTGVAVAAPPAAPPSAPAAASVPAVPTVPPVDLGGLPGLLYTNATAINDHGDVVGSGYSSPYDNHGFRWSQGALTALPDTARAPFRINNAGQIAGTLPGRFYSPGFVLRPDGTVVALDFSTSDQNERGEVVGTGPVTGGGTHAKLWRDNHTFDLGAPAGHTSDARAISSNGWILGEIQDSSHGDDYFARWIRGRWVPLPTPSGYGSDINGRGDVVGWVTNADGVTHAMLWQGDHAIDLDPTDPLSTAVAINDAGQILGDTFDPVTNIGRILLWDHGQQIDLGTFGGLFTRPIALNQRGDIIVGTSTAAFRRSHGRTVQLGGVGAWPAAINNRGQVVGTIQAPDGTSHAALWN
ncbi:hypothetical protein [Frankia sp. R82]|uniref:hypothetical protein n=1 Tax=Frankia sp. R82 TaxID=2950553 RepID=UPI00204341D6|nr:hypothetical protein [Frankia sp. R82]MCM3882902.1 hypothetical protein [Frankia sp. R82]